LAPGSGVAEANATHVALLLWYTHSRYKVGDGQATCSGGCACEPQLLRTALRRPYGTQVRLRGASRKSGCVARFTSTPRAIVQLALQQLLVLFGWMQPWACPVHGSQPPGAPALRPSPLAGTGSALTPLPCWWVPWWRMQDHLWLMLVTRSPTCRLTVRTLNTTETAG
jgi:hypothetical protein